MNQRQLTAFAVVFGAFLTNPLWATEVSQLSKATTTGGLGYCEVRLYENTEVMEDEGFWTPKGEGHSFVKTYAEEIAGLEPLPSDGAWFYDNRYGDEKDSNIDLIDTTKMPGLDFCLKAGRESVKTYMTRMSRLGRIGWGLVTWSEEYRDDIYNYIKPYVSQYIFGDFDYKMVNRCYDKRGFQVDMNFCDSSVQSSEENASEEAPSAVDAVIIDEVDVPVLDKE